MADRLVAGGFEDVDRTGSAEAFAAYLERIGTDERVRKLNRTRAETAGIGAGHRVLDVGCGVGFDASILAELVAPGGHVVGVDQSAGMVERAAARLVASGLPVEFRTGDAHALPFGDGTFDAAWTERVLVHVADPALVVREMIRVVRPGGTVVIAEADYHAYVVDSLDPTVATQMMARHARGLRHPDIGRRVRRLCLDAGAAEVRMRPEVRLVYELEFADKVLLLRDYLAAAVAAGEVDAERAAAWWAGLEDLQRRGRFLAALEFFIAFARVAG